MTATISVRIYDDGDKQEIPGVHICLLDEKGKFIKDGYSPGAGSFDFSVRHGKVYKVSLPKKHGNYELHPKFSPVTKIPEIESNGTYRLPRSYVKIKVADSWKDYLDDIAAVLGDPLPEEKDLPTDADKHFRKQVVALRESIAKLGEHLGSGTKVTEKVVEATAAGLFGEIMPRLRALLSVAKARESKPPKGSDPTKIDYGKWKGNLSSAIDDAKAFANEVNAARANFRSD